MVPEVGIDPLKEFNQMLEVENNKLYKGIDEDENNGVKTKENQSSSGA